MAGELAGQLHLRLQAHLERLGRDLRRTFREIDPDASHRAYGAGPPEERSTSWRHQLIRAAREVNVWANLTGGTWWAHLGLTVLGQPLRYVAAVQRVGDRDVGVLALTVFAELPQPEGSGDAAFVRPTSLIRLSSTDGVTMVGGQAIEEIWPEVESLLSRTLAATVDAFGSQLG